MGIFVTRHASPSNAAHAAYAAVIVAAAMALACGTSNSGRGTSTDAGPSTGASTTNAGGANAGGANAGGANAGGANAGGAGGAHTGASTNAGGASTNAGGASNTGGTGGPRDASAGGIGGAGGEAGNAGADSAANYRRATCAESAPPPLTPTYFVDFDGGSDAADGRSTATAWKHAPGDSAATAAAAKASLAAGDAVLFKGGVHYEGSIAVPASGTSSAPVVYDGNRRGTWGSGLAIIDGEETRSSGISLQGKSYVVIDSFVLQSFDKSTSSTAVSIDGGSNDVVTHCNISDVYYPKNPGGTSWEKQFGTGISVNDSPLTSVNHNLARDVGNAGISFSAESGNVIDGGDVSCNEVTNMNWGIVVALGNSDPGTKLTGVTLLGNYIHDFDQYYVSSVWHRDGIFVFARPDTDQVSVENLEIAYNYFEDNTSGFGSTAWLYFEYVCTGFNVHHNVLNASRSYYGVRVLGDGFQVAGNHVFANNVIDNANGMGDGMHMQESSGIRLVNNIFYDDGHGYIVATSSMQGFQADYDLFYRTGGPGSVVSLNAGPAEDPGGDEHDLASLQSSTAFEQHGLYGDPQFSADPTTIDSDPSGFLPTADSPAIDHGTMLSYTTDFAGNPIPSGKGPDIGAYERQ